ncbi:hypothetical protein ACVGVM_28870 (plasmid) [Pseudonocardia bannensis]|uniref:Uncharacterized protein n=1 Tax=Pseudonocardia bannensis TaxID=630973 RepID=A0A848DPL5_9PSEU|nr:hypothetical protein [Pseudonocardia bannensis]NMH94475.1 hypothetical protein [Pseudonocardia bannensis]
MPAGRAEEFHAALAAYRAGTDLGRAWPGPQTPAQPGPPPSLGGTRFSPDLIGMHIAPPPQPADGAVRAVGGVPGPPLHWLFDDDPDADLAVPRGGPSAAVPATARRPPPAGEGHDLAAHRSGQAAADVAAELRAAAPVWSALARLLGLRTRERAWRVGAAGERITARRLRRLTEPWWARLADRPARWHVLHAVPPGRPRSTPSITPGPPCGSGTTSSP